MYKTSLFCITAVNTLFLATALVASEDQQATTTCSAKQIVKLAAKAALNRNPHIKVSQGAITIEGNKITLQEVAEEWVDPQDVVLPPDYRCDDLDNEFFRCYKTEKVYEYNKCHLLTCVSTRESAVEYDDYSTLRKALYKQNNGNNNNVQHLQFRFGKNVIPCNKTEDCAAYKGNLLVTADHTGQIAVFTVERKNPPSRVKRSRNSQKDN